MIYSVKLGFYNAGATGNFPLFTATTGVTTIIRDITGVGTSSPTNLEGYLLINGVGFWGTGPVPAVTGYHWDGRLVLSAGDVVSFDVAAGTGSMYVSGYELS